MKLIKYIAIVLLLVSPCFAANKVVDIDFSQGQAHDRMSGVSANQLSTIGASTGTLQGVLTTFHPEMDQLIDTSAINDITTWWTLSGAANSTYNSFISDNQTQGYSSIKYDGVFLSSGQTYMVVWEAKAGADGWVSLYIRNGVTSATPEGGFNLSAGTLGTQDALFSSSISSVGDGWYRCAVCFTKTDANSDDRFRLYAAEGDGDRTVDGDGTSASFYIRNINVVKLPSGNVIGSDLFDQESTTSITSGSDTAVGSIYRIVSQSTLDFTTVGAPDNDADTVFIATAVDTLGSGDELDRIDSPHKGTYGNPYSLGTEAITAQNDRDFSSGTIGNWVIYDDSTDSTVTYSTADLDGADDKQALITVDETTDACTYAYAQIPSTALSLTANKLHTISAWVHTPAANTLQDAHITVTNMTGAIVVDGSTTIGDDDYTKITAYVYLAADIVGEVNIGFDGDPADGDLMYIDDNSVRAVQTSWAPTGTNTLSIDADEDQMVFTYVDTDTLATLTLADAADQSDDLTVGKWYQVTCTDCEADNGDIDIEIAESDDTELQSITLTGDAAADDYEIVFRCTNATTNKIQFDNAAATEIARIGKLEIKEIPDYAYLSPPPVTLTDTSPAQPVFDESIDGTRRLVGEGSGVNLIWYSEDFSYWTNSNTTDTADVTGPDGTANSATTLTATDANGTLKYTVAPTLDGSTYTYSIWMKRLSGTGNIDLTEDDGSTWTTKTLTSSWQRFSITGTETSPVVGIRIVTNGDSIAIFGAQLEPSAFMTSYIKSNGCPTARATKAADGTIGYQWTQSTRWKTALSSSSEFTLAVNWTPMFDAGDCSGEIGIVSVSESANSVITYDCDNTQFEIHDGTNTAFVDCTIVAETEYNIVGRGDYDADGGSGYLAISEGHGGSYTHGSTTAYDGSMGPGNEMWLAWSNEYPGHYGGIYGLIGYLSNAQIEAEIWDNAPAITMGF